MSKPKPTLLLQERLALQMVLLERVSDTTVFGMREKRRMFPRMRALADNPDRTRVFLNDVGMTFGQFSVFTVLAQKVMQKSGRVGPAKPRSTKRKRATGNATRKKKPAAATHPDEQLKPVPSPSNHP